MQPEKKTKVSFNHKNGSVEGIYYSAGDATPLVLIVNGHNGFYSYGMFPYIQKIFLENSISSYSFNFSHGGIIGDNDFFEDMEKYEKNCMRLETEDVFCILENWRGKFDKHSKLVLLAHSLGGVPLIFSAKKAAEQHVNIDGVILVSTVKTLHFWPVEMIKEWALAGVFYKKNNRTKQELPQGFEFLQEILKSHTDWNVEEAIKSILVPILIVHGENDEAIPVEHGISIFDWIKPINPNSELKVIPNATHTFNTKHPFEQPTVELNTLLDSTVAWIKNLF